MLGTRHIPAAPRHGAAAIAGSYFLFGTLWILLSDTVLNAFVLHSEQYHYQLIKGFGFITLTSVLLFVLVRSHTRRLHASLEALRERDLQIRAAMFAARDGLWEWNIAERIVSVSPEWALALGHNPDALGKDVEAWRALLHPDDLAEVTRKTEDYLAGKTAEYEARYRVRDHRGEWRWVHDRGMIVEADDQGRPKRMMGSLRDITEFHRVEQALAASEARLQSILRAAPIGLGQVKERRFDWANDALCRMFGYEQHEVIGASTELLYDGHAEFVRTGNISTKQMAEQGHVSYEARGRRKDGQILQALIRIEALDGKDAAAGAVFAVVDLTENKKLEAQLRQAQKLEAVGQLASGIAHDFSNLLMAITGYCSLARQSLSPDHKAVQLLKSVEDAADQAGGVTRSLLTFTRNSVVEKLPVDVAGAAESSVRLLRRLLPADIEMKIDLPDRTPPPVLADRTELQQVILNLAINARDAMPNGGSLAISVGTTNGKSDSPPSHVRLTVSDTGCGMEAEVRERIFEPFFTTKAVGQGTGLGLAIVHAIVKDHNARMQIQSDVGKGTTFQIDWPIIADASEIDVPSRIAESAPEDVIPVLVLQRDEQVQHILTSSLAAEGYDPTLCQNGKETIELLAAMEERAADFRLIIADANAGDMSAVDLLASAREMGCNAPAIVIADESNQELDDQLDENSLLLQKPFAMAELLRIVHRVTRRSQDAGFEPLPDLN